MAPGGAVGWRDERCRVVVAAEPFAGFCRVVWNAHVREMTDLEPDDRAHLMRVVFATEAALRALFDGSDVTIGEALLRAKAAASGEDGRTWILFGDPATRLRR